MIDLTPLDVRNKRGDFKKTLRGYDPQDVDTFLQLVAERLEDLVRENLGLRERTQMLQQQVDAQTGREQAVHEALVTAQELRTDIRQQAQREAEHVLKEAHTEARRMVAEAEAEARIRQRTVERQADQGTAMLGDLERRRLRFLKSFRQLLERELDSVEVEESKPPLEERPIDLDLGGPRGGAVAGPPPLPSEVSAEVDVELHDETASGETDGEARDIASLFADPAPPGPSPRAAGREENLLLYLNENEEDRKGPRG